jgi:hypothetical protein
MRKNEPVTAFLFTLMGGMFILIGGIISTYFGPGRLPIGYANNAGVIGFLGNFSAFYGFIGILSGLLLLVCSYELHTKDKTKVKIWSTIALGASVLSIFDLGGFIIGFIIAVIGSIMGLMD